jgi:hypothetical protein
VPRKATNLALVVYDAARRADGVVGDSETALFVGLLQAHAAPCPVLLVPCLISVSGALLKEGIGNLVVDVLLLPHVLVREVNVAIEVLEACRLAKAEQLVLDETILYAAQLVEVLHNCPALHQVLDKSISADGNTKTNVAVNHKGRGGEQGAEVQEGGVIGKQALSPAEPLFERLRARGARTPARESRGRH